MIVTALILAACFGKQRLPAFLTRLAAPGMSLAMSLIMVIFLPSTAQAADLYVNGGGGGGGGDYDGGNYIGGGKTGGYDSGGSGLRRTADTIGTGGGGAYAGSQPYRNGQDLLGADGDDSNGGAGGGSGAYAGGAGGGIAGENGANALGIASVYAEGGKGGRGGTDAAGGGDGGKGGGFYVLADGLNSGSGGGGGGNITYANTAVSLGKMNITGGDGGDGSTGGGGGGGHAVLNNSNLTITVDEITVQGGNGGLGSQGETSNPDDVRHGGGGGGGAVLSLTNADVNVAGDFNVIGGSGGGLEHSGGGGTATVRSSASNISVGGNLSVRAGEPASGNVLAGQGGSTKFQAHDLTVGASGSISAASALNALGGDAIFSVSGILRTAMAVFTKQTTDLTVDIEELAVGPDTHIHFDKTLAADTRIRTITFSENSILAITQNAGDMNFAAIKVSGTGSQYSVGSNYFLAADGKQLYFDLTGVGKNQTMLAGNNLISVDGKTGVTVAMESINNMNQGDEIILIADAVDNGFVTKHFEKSAGAREYEFEILHTGTNLATRLARISLNQTKARSYLMGSVARTALILNANDLVMEKGTSIAMGVAKETITQWDPRPVVFAAASYADEKHETGSNLDSRNFNALVGVSFPRCLGPVSGVLAPFIEGGYGKYDGYNDDGSLYIHSDGKTWHLGGGLLGRLEIGSIFFAEASAQAAVFLATMPVLTWRRIK